VAVYRPVRQHSVLQRIAIVAFTAPRRVLAIAAGVFGMPVAKTLCACDFADPTSESATAAKLLTDEFDAGDALVMCISFVARRCRFMRMF
jgi:RND superfamily putative drug exporter